MKKTVIKDEDTLENILTMKRNLKHLRKIAGWTSEELGNQLGLSKQTINGLENNPDIPMSRVQYLALLTIFEAKAEDDSNDALNISLNNLFFEKDIYKKNKTEIDSGIAIIAESVAKVGIGSAIVASFMSTLFTPLGLVTTPVAITGAILSSILLKNKDKDK